MAQATKRGFGDVMIEAAGLYPAAVRYGGGYWSEMVGATSGHVADVLDALLRMARQPDRGQEVMAEILERSGQYAVALGSTFERILLDFNQALVKLGRMSPAVVASVAAPGRDARRDPTIDVFQQLADFAATEALRLSSGQGRPDVPALRSRLESCLAELRRLEGAAAPPAS